MSAWMNAAAGLTKAWTSAYTVGLSGAVKENRRAEIESDLWEQRCAAEFAGETPPSTAGHVFSRIVLGIPADISWRAQAGSSARREGKIVMNETWTERLTVLVGFALAAVPVFLGLAVVAGNGEWSSTTERVVFGALWAALGGLMVAGLLMSRRSPRAGPALVAVGVIAICIAWYWAAVIMVPAGLVLVAIAYARGQSSGWPHGTGTA